ncbi:NifB/NifX family molybdenum-iron cluster-binding protein [Photobacterium chitinilyticum]|uniref:Dinitrogenase iron-molybdenum cofactor biosynthesis domain-containing protein n=1 Tax=Photobacterium chitinilyticum TaxID=2485123 RepID=A0A3S3T078_9GAMM|nr:NifB/NifX family molybdenum-iron cluster-binding protein [Photobacterium chitinilyticum]RWX56064.1 hypothetical protein EDI28_07160 [Photobacterium chitinilyticum]
MITAIPMNENHIANHFSKAEHFLFINEQGVEISRYPNPVQGAHYAGKKELLKLLLEQQAKRIVVRNIGQQMLGKLLSHQLAVVQTDSGRRSAVELVNSEAVGLVSLTDPEQGRPSPNHDGCRHGQRRCHSHDKGHGDGCGHRHGNDKGHGDGCGHRHGNDKGHGNGCGKGHGRGGHGESKGRRCCHKSSH